ncbi:unnamed protein product [Toxocara canis]|uniref:Large ribosomal subunit protein uL4m n=1 Tax=Toxocara canis TaxID=6265 RepID=A0A183VF56_TOXCA|nr:unnamed protein product [Toxocara canis]
MVLSERRKEQRKGIIDLHPEVFRCTPRIDLLHRNITWQLNYRNLQLTKQLSKAEMPGGGRKPWPQKKTGRTHAGSIRAPHFHTGGFANGVRGPRTWFYMLPDAIRLHGLCSALTIKHAQNDLVIVDDFSALPSAEPQYLHELADTRNWGYSVLFVSDSAEVVFLCLTCFIYVISVGLARTSAQDYARAQDYVTYWNGKFLIWSSSRKRHTRCEENSDFFLRDSVNKLWVFCI